MDKVVGWVRCSAYDSEQNIFRDVGWQNVKGRIAVKFDSEAFLEQEQEQETN